MKRLCTAGLLLALLCPGRLLAEEPEGLQGSRIPPAPPAAAIDAALQKGVAFLVSHQNEDGSWGSFESARPYEVLLGTTASFSAFGDATTALCVTALMAPARKDKDAARALEKGAAYLFRRAPVKRATAQVLYSLWTQIYVLEAASAVLQEPRLKEFHPGARKAAARQLKVLQEIQANEGGFAYYDFSFAGQHPTGAQSCSFTTAAALIALHHAKDAGIDVPAKLTEDAVRSLARLRFPNGAYAYSMPARLYPHAMANRLKGSLGRSQVCNLALWKYGKDVGREDLKRGLNQLFRHHHFIEMGKGRPYPHESWYQTAGYYFFFGHYYAAHVARELPKEEGSVYLGALASTMCRLQDPAGSWWDFPLYGYHKAYGTAFALLTLQLAGTKGDGQ